MRAAWVSIGLIVVPLVAGSAGAGPTLPEATRIYSVTASFDGGTQVFAFGGETLDGRWLDGEVRVISGEHELSAPLRRGQLLIDLAASTARLQVTVAGCAIRGDFTAAGLPEPRLVPAVPFAVGVEVSRAQLVGRVDVCGKALGKVRDGQIKSAEGPQFLG